MNPKNWQSEMGFFPMVWDLTALGLWGYALAGPVFLVLGVYTFVAGDGRTTMTLGPPMVSTGQKIASVLVYLLMGALGWSYILVYRRTRLILSLISRMKFIL